MKRPKVVVGFGGYTTIPALCAAKLLGIPIIIHEGNAFMGKANRFLQRFAKTVAISFPGTKTLCQNTCTTGMPLRSDFLKNYDYVLPNEKFHILVIGGSQGASLFSKLIPDAINDLPKDIQKKIVIHHQCKQEQIDLTRQEYESLKCEVVLKPFFHNMAEQYDFAHLVITRAGASSVFELAATKRPCILYPFMASVEGDQLKNAHVVEALDAGWVLNEKETGPKCLAKLLMDIFDDQDVLLKKSKNMQNLLLQNPTKALASLVLKVANKRKI